MLQIIDLKNNELFSQVSSEESATVLGGTTGVNLTNIHDGISNFSSKHSLLSIDSNKLFTVDLSRLTVNLVMILPTETPEPLTLTNSI